MSKFLKAIKEGGILPVGLDDGFDEVKIVLPDGTALRMPSHAKTGKDPIISFGDADKTVFGYSTNSKEFMAGSVLEHDSTSSDDYPTSDLNRVIVMHALRMAGLDAKHELYICSGLPLKKYYKLSSPNASLIKKKVANLKQNNVIADDKYNMPIIKEHQVLPEGLASWFDFITERNQDGTIIKNADRYNMRIAVIDIGGRTTDIAVLHKGQLDYSRSSTIEAGMLSVKESVKEMLNDELDININNEQMHHAIAEGKIKAWGDWINVNEIVQQAERTVAERISVEAKRRLKNAADIDHVIFVGGTVNKIPDLIEGWFKQQKVADEPGFANARGMQKYIQMMADKASK